MDKYGDDSDTHDEFIFAPVTGPHWNVIQLTGKKWNRLILEHLMVDGPLRYSELQRAIDGISDKVLADALQELEEVNLIERDVKDTRPVAVEYAVTDAGEALQPVMEVFSEWLDVYGKQLGCPDE